MDSMVRPTFQRDVFERVNADVPAAGKESLTLARSRRKHAKLACHAMPCLLEGGQDTPIGVRFAAWFGAAAFAAHYDKQAKRSSMLGVTKRNIYRISELGV